VQALSDSHAFSFDWDPVKAESNEAKHGVTFDEAATIFADSASITIHDEAHSTSEEDRWITLGMSDAGRLLVVVHTDLDDLTIRIISSRKATRAESSGYRD